MVDYDIEYVAGEVFLVRLRIMASPSKLGSKAKNVIAWACDHEDKMPRGYESLFTGKTQVRNLTPSEWDSMTAAKPMTKMGQLDDSDDDFAEVEDNINDF